MKQCNKCNQNLSYSNFSLYKRAKDGYKATCKKCIAKRARELNILKGINVSIDRSLETEDTKICTKCKQLLNKTSFSGKNSWCNKCRAADNRKRLNLAERFIPIVTDTQKECGECHKLKDFSEFYASKRGRKKLSTYCKKCHYLKFHNKEKARKYTSAYRKNNREVYLANHRLCQFKRKSTMKAVSDGSITKEFLIKLYSASICYYCNKSIPIKNRTLEHKKPLSRGGKHTENNCTMACFSCNSSKGNKTEKEYLKYLYERKEKNIS